MDRFDAVIVGAGPAGSRAAELLARSGVRVALFDARSPEEAKACGGGVTSKALKAWPFLLEAGGRTVEEVLMQSPSGGRVRLKLSEPFAIYSRRALDAYLRERAVKAGANVFAIATQAKPSRETNGTWAIHTRDGRRWGGEVLVGADGANSAVARMLAGSLPNSEMEVAFGYRTPLDEACESPTVIAFLPGWAGYAWAFPRLDHISFGIATEQDSFDHKSLDRLLRDFIADYYERRLTDGESRRRNRARGRDRASDSFVSDSASRAVRYAGRIPKLVPATWDSRRFAGDGWALLGDAAGFADPITGEGIYYALRSAELFAEAFLANDLASYEKACREDFGLDLRRAAQIRRRFYGQFLREPFVERMIGFARTHRGIRRTLLELVAGDQKYLDLKSTLLRRAGRFI